MKAIKVVEQALLKHQEAKTASTQLRGSFDKLVAGGQFAGLKTSDLPETALGEVCGFDVFFVDLHLRMLVTGSLSIDSSLNFECWRMPVAYGIEPENVLALPVVSGGKIVFVKTGEEIWFDESKGALGLLAEILSLPSNRHLDKVR